MAETIITTADPKTIKKWSSRLAVDTQKKAYFDRKFEGTGDNNVIERKTEVESDAGDRISFDLSVQLRGEPTTGDNRLEGKEEDLKFYTDEVVIDQLRHAVSAGGRMTRKRTAHDLRQVAKDRLSDYWAKWLDQYKFMVLSGARGINADFIQGLGYTGHAGMSFEAPDAAHILYGGSATSKATVTSADKFSRELVERATVQARMMQSQDPQAANMLPVSINGESHYVCVMSPFQEHDLRVTSGTTGWLEIQKAAAAAEGRNNPIFRGGLGMINNVVLHSHEWVVRFADYGTGANLPAARALFMGRQAAVIAYGTSGGVRFNWKEELKDYDNEIRVAAGPILGMKKTRFKGRDFGVMSLDTYAKDPNVA